MKFMNYPALIFGAALLAIIALYQTQPWYIDDATAPTIETSETEGRETAFSNIGLQTNTAISSVPLKEILGGGPPKDGIPAILNPKFTSVEEADEWLEDEGVGIIYENDGITRFYPYAVLYWHEIVNDNVAGLPITVTFCPLCGSAIIFDAKDDIFGVSGKLWESNLLMYDKKTETLWSQIRGEGIVGDRTGETLEILDANVISFAELKERYTDADVLSKDTGYRRNYGQSPYGNYEENNQLFFPVSKSDEAFNKKELFHLVYVGDKSVGFKRADLFEAGSAEVEVDGRTIRAEIEGESTIKVTDVATGEQFPGFITMWFSWVTNIDKERVIWSK